jgi:hypothetical protein
VVWVGESAGFCQGVGQLNAIPGRSAELAMQNIATTELKFAGWYAFPHLDTAPPPP